MDRDLSRAVAEIRDRDQIRELLSRYCRGIDRHDPDIIRSCYHPDAHDDHGPFKGSVEDFIAYVMPYLQRDLFSMHQLTSQTIRLDGDTAHTESYFIALHEWPEGGKVVRMMGFGRYVDRLEKRDGEWRIARRLTVMESNRQEDRPFPTPDNHGFIRGKHDRTDVSYQSA